LAEMIQWLFHLLHLGVGDLQLQLPCFSRTAHPDDGRVPFLLWPLGVGRVDLNCLGTAKFVLDRAGDEIVVGCICTPAEYIQI
jgi:hypothetical protein